MKKSKTLLLAMASLALPGAALADVTLTFDSNPGSLNVVEIPLSDDGEEINSVITPDETTLQTVYKPSLNSASRIVFLKKGQRQPVAEVFLTSPTEEVAVAVTGDNVDYSGTALMEGVDKVKKIEKNYMTRMSKVMKGESDEDAEAVEAEAVADIKAFIAGNPSSPALPYAGLMLDGEDFLTFYENLDPALKNSIFSSMLQAQKQNVDREVAIKRLYDKLESGKELAPNFTLPDPEGKMVSLDQFRGKWVILDFWGSWCGWCIKGIPELKEAYDKYKGRLEVIGIDCRDDREDWLEAIKKYDLPWVHVYNDMENNDSADRVDRAYGIQGFPTKIIINPEGYVKKIVVGEAPSFYTLLADYLK